MPFDGTQTITIVFLISLVSIASTLYNSYAMTKRDTKAKENEIRTRAAEFAKIETTLDAISTDQRTTLQKVENTAATLRELSDAVQHNTWTIADHEKRIAKIENKLENQ